MRAASFASATSASSRLTRCEPGHVFSVDHSKPLWNQNVQGGTYRFGFRVTKDLFRALVERSDEVKESDESNNDRFDDSKVIH